MIKVSKKIVCKKIDKRQWSFPPNTNKVLGLFIISEWDRIFESVVDK